MTKAQPPPFSRLYQVATKSLATSEVAWRSAILLRKRKD